MNRITGKVIIAGAGPGDPGLLTVKALRAVEDADVILYDALVNTTILTYAKPSCRLIYVGKRKGCHAYPQHVINELLVHHARSSRVVLRLKGGDPYVFGRGHEEYTHVAKHDIEVEIIPGISSAIAGPACCGIPVTHRGTSESLWVITGTLSDGNFSSDIKLAARSSATIVVLMGVSHLAEIAHVICELRSTAEPMAIIQNGTTNQQQAVKGPAYKIVELAEQYEIGAPAIIVIGKVVDIADAFHFLNLQEANLRLAV